MPTKGNCESDQLENSRGAAGEKGEPHWEGGSQYSGDGRHRCGVTAREGSV